MQLLLLLLFYHSAEVQHLKIVNESYGKHLLFTVKLSSILLLLCWLCDSAWTASIHFNRYSIR